MTEYTGWRLLSACTPSDAELFYEIDPDDEPGLSEPERRKVNAEREAKAREICAVCPVRAACLEDAVVTADVFAFRGGMSVLERYGTRQAARAAAQAQQAEEREMERRRHHERIVHCWMKHGRIAEYAADELGISPKTVRSAAKAYLADRNRSKVA